MTSENEDELLSLLEAYVSSVADLANWKRKLGQAERAGISFLNAVAIEAARRQQLLDMNSPTKAIAILRLLHLLAGVLTVQNEFDEASLAAIIAEVERLIGKPFEEK